MEWLSDPNIWVGLLTMISWMVTLTAPLFDVMGKAISGRDLILLTGGAFLLFKATMELHERVEGKSHVQSGPRVYASLGAVIAQIIVLDAGRIVQIGTHASLMKQGGAYLKLYEMEPLESTR